MARLVSESVNELGAIHKWYSEPDGTITHQKTFDVEKVIERCTARFNANTRSSWRENTQVMSIPAEIFWSKAKELKLDVRDPEQKRKLINYFLRDRDHSKFRTHPGSV